MQLTLSAAAQWMQAVGTFDAEATVVGYSIDSRTIRPGELFFAVRGERLDGHAFAMAALERGAVAAVVNGGWHANGIPHEQLLHVDDPLAALQRLAGAVRRNWDRRIVGVTGSAGKTTTKDVVACVLGCRYRVLKTQGNLNNGFGVPLQLLRLQPEDEMAVIEIGMNHAGEIRHICSFTQPDWAVITNVSAAHVENFSDGIAGVARAKYELVDALPQGGVAILNGDDAYVSQFGRELQGKAIYYGTSAGCDLLATGIAELGTEGMRFTAEFGGERAEVRLQLLGRHNVMNALAALAAGLECGIPLAEGAAALAGLVPGNKRGEVVHWNGASLLNDCYNSNPAALQAMVKTLLSVPAARHIVVAGEMLELGSEAPALHAKCGRMMFEAGVSCLVGVRGNAEQMVAAARACGLEAEFVATPEQAGEWLRKYLQPGDAVLLKASRGVQLERALEALGPHQ